MMRVAGEVLRVPATSRRTREAVLHERDHGAIPRDACRRHLSEFARPRYAASAP